ncbi:MAG: hypothetical protein OEO77_02125 [Acidimicrobiia bacterium]|nr:hypothetical protein [Acidimicrobiia bacterium]
MSPASALTLGGLLVAFFLVLVAVMLLQEMKRRPGDDPAVYALDEAVVWIRSHLDLAVRQRLDAGDVLRILEWQVYVLQQSVKGTRRGEAEVVVGVSGDVVDLIVDRCASLGVRYDPADVSAVLELQGGYLSAVGAVGDPVGEENT